MDRIQRGGDEGQIEKGMNMLFTFDQAMKLLKDHHVVRRQSWEKSAYIVMSLYWKRPRYFYEGKTRWRSRLWRALPVDRLAEDWEDLGINSWVQRFPEEA